MVMVRCPSCKKNLNVPDKYAGKKGKCPACQGVLLIPAASEEIPDTVPAPPKLRKPAAPAPVEEELAEEVEVEERIAPQPMKRAKPRPAPVEEVEEVADEEVEEAVTARPANKRRRPVEDEEDEDRPPPKKKRKDQQSEWAECPKCGAADATRVRWTMWGGMIGPMLINTVRCKGCGTNYNGNHGDYNTVRILIFVLVELALAAALAGVIAFLPVLMNH